MVDQWNSDSGTEEQLWWNSGTMMVEQWNNDGTMRVEQWNRYSGIVEQWNSGTVEQWNRDGGTVEQIW